MRVHAWRHVLDAAQHKRTTCCHPRRIGQSELNPKRCVCKRKRELFGITFCAPLCWLSCRRASCTRYKNIKETQQQHKVIQTTQKHTHTQTRGARRRQMRAFMGTRELTPPTSWSAHPSSPTATASRCPCAAAKRSRDSASRGLPSTWLPRRGWSSSCSAPSAAPPRAPRAL